MAAANLFIYDTLFTSPIHYFKAITAAKLIIKSKEELKAAASSSLLDPLLIACLKALSRGRRGGYESSLLKILKE